MKACIVELEKVNDMIYKYNKRVILENKKGTNTPIFRV